MHGCWKRLCPDQAQDFNGFEETCEYSIMEVVHLMNELTLGVSIEGADELIAYCSESMLNVDLINIHVQKEK